MTNSCRSWHLILSQSRDRFATYALPSFLATMPSRRCSHAASRNSMPWRDVRRLPLEARQEGLKLLLPPRGFVHYGDHVVGRGIEFLDAACEQRLEGIVAKKLGSAYVAKRSRDWLKIKCQLRQEFVVGGYTEPQGSRARFGALHLGLYDQGRLVYVSKVGTGFDDATLDRVWEKLRG